MLHSYGNGSISFERNLTRNELVQQNAECIDVCGRAGLLSLKTFRSHICRSSIYFAGGSYHGGGLVDCIAAAIKKMRDTKIDKIDLSLLIE